MAETAKTTETKTKENTITKQYELRALSAKDVFRMSSIIGKIGVDEFKKSFDSDQIRSLVSNQDDNVDNTEQIGLAVVFDIVDVITRNLPKAESEIYTFLASLSGMAVKEIEDLPMNVFIEMIVDVIRKDEFKDFIQVVSKLFQ